MTLALALALTHGDMDPQAYMDPNIPELATKLEGKLPAAPVIKGICHVDNCYTDLSHLREYHLRYKVRGWGGGGC